MSEEEKKAFLYEAKQYIVAYLDLSRLSDAELESKIEEIVESQLEGRYITIEERVNLVYELFSSIRGLGLLDIIIKDDDITEVMINSKY